MKKAAILMITIISIIVISTVGCNFVDTQNGSANGDSLSIGLIITKAVGKATDTTTIETEFYGATIQSCEVSFQNAGSSELASITVPSAMFGTSQEVSIPVSALSQITKMVVTNTWYLDNGTYPTTSFTRAITINPGYHIITITIGDYYQVDVVVQSDAADSVLPAIVIASFPANWSCIVSGTASDSGSGINPFSFSAVDWQGNAVPYNLNPTTGAFTIDGTRVPIRYISGPYGTSIPDTTIDFLRNITVGDKAGNSKSINPAPIGRSMSVAVAQNGIKSLSDTFVIADF